MNQDLNTMLKISEERKGDQCDALPGEEKCLIYNRNKAWAEKTIGNHEGSPRLLLQQAPCTSPEKKDY